MCLFLIPSIPFLGMLWYTLILAANIGGTTFATVTIPTTVPFFSLIGSHVVFHMVILTRLLPP